MTKEPTSQATAPAPLWGILVAFVLLYICWGTTYEAIRRGVHNEQLPPCLFGGVRLACAGLVLLGWVVIRGGSLRVPLRDLRTVTVSGAFMFAGGNGLLSVGEKTVPASAAAVLAATTPLWMALCEWLWPQGERQGLRSWFGLILGLVGVVVLSRRHQSDGSVIAVDPGLLLVLGSAISWAFGTVLVRHRRVTIDHLAAAGYQLFLGGTLLTLIGIGTGELQRLPETITLGALGAFFWLLIFGSLTGFVAFNWLLRHVSATRVGTYAYVNPLIAVLVSWTFGEPPTWHLAVGGSVILLGVALVRGKSIRPEDVVEPD